MLGILVGLITIAMLIAVVRSRRRSGRHHRPRRRRARGSSPRNVPASSRGALAQLDRRTDALAVLSVAEETADRCGALGLRDEITRELRQLGRRVSRLTRRGQPGAGIDALSDRQRQNAELAAEGHTNRAIAATLYLSEKTVERHLSTAFVKLGVPSRAALAAQVAIA